MEKMIDVFIFFKKIGNLSSEFVTVYTSNDPKMKSKLIMKRNIYEVFDVQIENWKTDIGEYLYI